MMECVSSLETFSHPARRIASNKRQAAERTPETSLDLPFH
jgi:hypothetical protein